MKKTYIKPLTKEFNARLGQMIAASNPTNGFGGNATDGEEGDAKEDFSEDFDW